MSDGGSWKAHESYEYDFSFVAPQGPSTYRGANLNIDWPDWHRVYPLWVEPSPPILSSPYR